MRAVLSVAAAFVASAILLVMSGGNVAFASFHCVRIHAVMGGFAGNNNIQYVELRLETGGQNFVMGHTLEFHDSAGTLKATFTFPSNATNGLTGDSILIATSEFNAAATGGMADYLFAGNTVGANGGDPLHPVQGMNGSVTWVSATSPGHSPNCAAQAPVDSVAYGTAAATYGMAAVALPAPGNSQALRLNNLAFMVTNNSTEYSLENVAAATSMVTVPNLPTDLTTPRNNGRTVIKLSAPASPSVGGIAEAPGLSSRVAPDAAAARGGTDYMPYEALGGGIAIFILGGAGWYAYRRRVAERA